MRKPILLILTNTFLLIAIIGLLAQSLLVVQRVAQVRSIHGKVEIQRAGSGSFVPLAPGDPVKKGDVVRTAANSSAEFGWLDGTHWKILGNSQLTIEKASYNSSKKAEISRLDLDSGQLLVRVSKKLPVTSGFEVKTPTALIATHGKIISVLFNEGFTAVDVLKGSADIYGNADGLTTNITPDKRAVETALGWKIRPVTDESAFADQPDFTRPLLDVTAQDLGNGYALVKGQTEADSEVSIGGSKVQVFGNGVFFKRVKAAVGPNSWNIQAIDPYGATNSLVKNLTMAPECPALAGAQKGN